MGTYVLPNPLDLLARILEKNLLKHCQQGSELNSCRLAHGRGGTIPEFDFISVDLFAPVLLITLFKNLGESWENDLLDQCKCLFYDSDIVPIQCILIQRRYLRDGPVCVAWGDYPSPLYAREAGLKFALNLTENRNHGFFLDMAVGRSWLSRLAEGKRVLNLFSYTCAFSVVAAAAGASKVVNVDLSSQALTIGRKNHQLNPATETVVEYKKLDILHSWGRLKRAGPFDVVVIDPPSSQKGSFDAERDYRKIIRRLSELVSPGADILACLNAPYLDYLFLQKLFDELFPEAQLQQFLPASEGFPEQDQNAGLKLLHYKVMPLAPDD